VRSGVPIAQFLSKQLATSDTSDSSAVFFAAAFLNASLLRLDIPCWPMGSLRNNRPLSLAAQHELAVFPIDANTLRRTQRRSGCQGGGH
jgi:hypothetical protein